MRDMNFGRQEKMTLYKLEYRRVAFKMARWAKEKPDVRRPFDDAVEAASKHGSDGKVSFKTLTLGRGAESPCAFDMDTLPLGEISMIYMNPDSDTNGITVCGRMRREKRIRVEN